MADAMTPSQMLAMYAQVGVTVVSQMERVHRLLPELPLDMRANLRRRIAEELLDSDGNRYSAEQRAEVEEAVFGEDAPAIPDLYRGFAAYMHLTGDLRKIVELKGQHGEETRIDEGVSDLHWAARWASFGLPLFSLTHGLVGALLLTEPPPFKPDEFELPFPTFAITIPPGLIPFLDGDRKNWAESLLVHRFRGFADGRTQDILQIDVRSRERNLWHRKPVAEILSIGPDNFARGGYELVEDDFQTIQAAVRLVRNLAAWLEAHGKGTPERAPKPSQRYRRDRDDNPVPTIWMVGREVKLSPELRQMATEVATGERRRAAGWKVRIKFWTRGHWRNQACGAGHRDRKLIFIQPFWKGPEGAAAWAHVYTDQEEKKS